MKLMGDHVGWQPLAALLEELFFLLLGVIGLHDGHDDLVARLNLFAEDNHVAHAGKTDENLFHLSGAYPVAGGLDHLVAAGDIVEEAVLVFFHDVAGVDDGFVQMGLIGKAGVLPENYLGLFGVVPVAMGDEGAPVDQFSLFARGALFALGVHHQDLHVGNPLADGVGPAVQLFGREEGGAERLGEPVHEEEPGVGEKLADAGDHDPGHLAAAVGEVAEMGEVGAVGELDLVVEELGPDGGHAGKAGDLFLDEEVQEILDHDELVQHHGRAVEDGSGSLVEAVVEVEGKDADDPVLLGDFEIGADDLGPVHHGAVGHHHPFGHAGGAGGVDEAGDVFGEAGHRGVVRREGCLEFGPTGVPFLVVGRLVHVDELLGSGQVVLAEQLAGGDHELDLAVVDDVLDLVFLEDGIDEDEDRPGHGGAEHGGELLNGFVQVDADPLAPLDAEAPDEPLHPEGLVKELGIGDGPVVVFHGNLVGQPGCGVFQQVA